MYVPFLRRPLLESHDGLRLHGAEIGVVQQFVLEVHVGREVCVDPCPNSLGTGEGCMVWTSIQIMSEGKRMLRG